jgi:hypothetical protein
VRVDVVKEDALEVAEVQVADTAVLLVDYLDEAALPVVLSVSEETLLVGLGNNVKFGERLELGFGYKVADKVGKLFEIEAILLLVVGDWPDPKDAARGYFVIDAAGTGTVLVKAALVSLVFEVQVMVLVQGIAMIGGCG